MSIATEIQRLQGAKASIKSAIEQKGVTVGDDLLISDYHKKIDEILGGGETLPNNITAINGNTWTQATNLGANGTLEIIHGLTDIPDVIVISSNVFDIKPSNYNLAYMFYETKAQSFGYSVYYNDSISTRVNYNIADVSGKQGITSVDSSKFTITTAGNRMLGAGVTYSWIALRWAK
jgi:hypothetical protein